MKALRVCTVASTVFGLLLLFALQAPTLAHAGMTVVTAGDRILTGELVVTNAARNKFRLVEHRGSFTAPTGTPVEALDGKPVQVELARDGRVLQIRQMQIHIEPITHGFEVVSGELMLRDPATRTFAIVGDDRTYVAPHGIDVGGYAGRLVEMRLDEQEQVVDINLIARSGDAPLSRSLRGCLLGGASLASGLSICRGGRSLRCADGEWVNLGTACN